LIALVSASALAIFGLTAPPASAVVPLTLTVTTTADADNLTGPCHTSTTTVPTPMSLRDAVCLANNVGAAQPVTIDVPGGTYALAAGLGELDLGTVVGEVTTIVGTGPGATVIDAGGHSRVLNIDPASVGNVGTALQNITVTGGSDSVFGGAGILAGAAGSTPDSLTLVGVTVTGNNAGGGAASLTNLPGGGLQFIGGRLSITNSTFSNNSTQSSPGSAIAYQAMGVGSELFSMSGTTISGNTSTNQATALDIVDGAVEVGSPSASIPMSISTSTFTGNTATGTNGPTRGAGLTLEAGSLSVNGSTFTGNTITGSGSRGAAIAVVSGAATLHHNRIVDNVAPASSQGTGLALVGAGTADATDNWWGCNAGPGFTGCDSTVGSPTTSPRLNLSGSAVTLLVSATAPVAADLTHDNLGASVSGFQPELDGLSMTFTNPLPGGATCTPGSATLSSGTASGSCTFNPNGNYGAGHLVVTVDHQAVTIPVTVNAPPTVSTSPTDQTVLAGSSPSFTATAGGYPAPTIQWQVSTNGGSTFTDISGATSSPLSFTATASQNQNQYRAVFTNGSGTATTAAAILTVHVPPSITSSATANFTAGTNSSFAITTSGLPAVSAINESGTLPSGLSFTDNGDGTASIAGTAAAHSGGVYPVTLNATNGISPDASQSLSVVVSAAPTVTTNPSDTTVAPGVGATFSAAADGYPVPTVQWQVSTDGGSTFTDISGATSTSYTVTATTTLDGSLYRAVFTNTIGSATSTAGKLIVRVAPAFTSTNATTFTVGSAGTFTVTNNGYPSPTITETGSLPTGVTLTDNGNGTATLAGTPAVGTGGVYTFTLKATNGVTPDGSQSFTLTINEAPHVNSGATATFASGVNSTFTVTTDRGYPVPALSVGSGLPAGLSFTDNGDGTATIAGTTTAAGSVSVTVTATNTVGSDHQSLAVNVTQPAAITSANATTFTAGGAGTFTVTTTGYPAASLSETGTLPSGVTLVDNGDGTATLSGTPAASSGGSYPITITAHNGIGSDATQSFTLTVSQSAAITSADATTFTAGSAGTFTVTTAGNPAPSLAVTGTLPSGVTFVDNGGGTATLSGTPAGATGGTYPVSITAHNGIGSDATQSFTLTVEQSAAITSASATTFTAGSAGTFTVTSTGNPTATISETGTLPTGVSLVDNSDGTATLAGTPAAGTGGTYPVALKGHNGVGADATQGFTLTVDQAPAITSANTVTFGAAVAATPFTVTTTGFPAPSLGETGTLPSGVTFVDNGDGTATLSGTPAAGTAGSYPISIGATNSVTSASQSFTLVVSVAPQTITFTSTPPTSPVVGQTYTVTADGGPSGNAVTFTIDSTSTGVCSISGALVTFNHPGACKIDAHQDGNGQYAAADNSQTVAATMAGTTTVVVVTATTVTATVSVQTPGAGTPAGTVAFSLNGSPIGTASLSGGVATLSYAVPTGQTQNVAAVYAGDPDFSASSGSTSRHDPTITATVTSSIPKTTYGWYRVPVTISFTCTPNGAPLTAPCPSPVTLSSNGAGQSVSRTIMATDGGAATVTTSGINIDRTPPTVSIAGVKAGAYYPGAAPKPRCVATDALSGVATCRLTSTTSGPNVTVTARATDKAGNARSTQLTYHVLKIYVVGATFKNGAYTLVEGRSYMVVALTASTSRPRYYDAVPFGQTPRPADNYFLPAGTQYGLHRYTIAVRIPHGMGRYYYWAFGVKIGTTMNVVKFHPIV
jgi:hypothetical protein